MTDSNSSLVRMLAVLDAFTFEKYTWTVEQLAAHFDYTQASTYRYMKALCNSGLLVRLPRGVYVVGARFIELESLIRETDPITKVAQPILRDLAAKTGCGVLLSNVYGNHLINVMHVPGAEPLELSYLRGRNLPWFKGAPSKAILAFMPRLKVRQLFETVFATSVDEELWASIVKELKMIRRVGFCVSFGELDPEIIGFGAPVQVESQVIGSVSLTCSLQRAEILNKETIGHLLMNSCAELSARLSSGEMPPVALPAP